MKITDVRTTLLTGPCTNDPYIREVRKLRSAAFIEVLTDNGPTGLGETYAGYFCPEVVPSIVEFFKPILVGQTVDDIPELWRRMYQCGNFWCRVGLGTTVLNGIEAALWDLKGKLLGQPVHALLGGCKHARLPAYATGGPSNYPKDKLAQKLDHYFSLGFRGVKVGAGSHSPDSGWYMPQAPAEAADFEADKVAFLRKHAGADAWLMMDAHMGNSPGVTWSLDVATAVAKALEPFNLFFFEEPLHYTDPWGYAELCRATTTPIAGGECLTAAYEWRVFAGQDSFDIGQPDASFTGGLGEFMVVAKMMADRGHQVATHAWGAGGSLMQNLHAGFAAPNTCILEIAPDYAGLHAEVVDGGFVMKDGYVLPPDRPGLGIVLTEETRRRYPFKPGSGEFNSVPGKILAIEMRLLIDVPVQESVLAALRRSGEIEVDCVTPPEEKARPLDAARIRATNVLFCTFPPTNFSEMQALQWIQIASTGFTQLFRHDLPGRGIRATNARGCFDVPIAEWNVAMMVNLVRDVRQLLRNQDAAVWDRSAIFQRELRGMTVGLWGYGGIGRETARLAKQLGLRVHVLTRTGAAGPCGEVYAVAGTGDPAGILPDRVFGASEVAAFLAELDFLVMGLPLTPATEGIVGERELSALPPRAFLLNPARGPLVQEKALLRALEEKWIAGAALDTHYAYPLPPDHALWKMPNVILTPHISGSSLSPRFKERLWDIFEQNVGRFRRGEPLLNELTAARLRGN